VIHSSDEEEGEEEIKVTTIQCIVCFWASWIRIRIHWYEENLQDPGHNRFRSIPFCFICSPSDISVSKDAGIEPRTVATLVLLAVRHSNHLLGWI
jgi:hypothetical protein